MVSKTSGLPEFVFFLQMESYSATVHVIQFGEIVFSRSFMLTREDSGKALITQLLHTHFAFNELTDNPSDLDRIIISGNVALPRNTCNQIQDSMGVKVDQFNVFNISKVKPVAGSFIDDDYNKVQNTIAIAVNEINGTEGYNFGRRVSNISIFFQEFKAQLIFSLILLFLVLAAWSFNPIIKNKTLEQQIGKLDADITAVFQSCFPDVKTMVDPVQQMQVKVNTLKKKKNLDDMDDHQMNIDLLNHISNALPASMDIILNRFVRTDKNLLVAGSADQFKTVDKMKNYFMAVEPFKEVDINSASMDKTDNRVKFSLKIGF